MGTNALTTASLAEIALCLEEFWKTVGVEPTILLVNSDTFDSLLDGPPHILQIDGYILRVYEVLTPEKFVEIS